MIDHFALFDTPVGTCGIVWSDRGILGVQLPDDDSAGTRARLLRRHPSAREAEPSPAVASAIAAIGSLLRGERTDLQHLVVDMSTVDPFDRRVYEAARMIKPGSTKTYGEIAREIGAPRAAREVGSALGRNPFAIVVPCHRVVAANGKTGGFSAGGGVGTKLRLLALEGGSGPLFDQN